MKPEIVGAVEITQITKQKESEEHESAINRFHGIVRGLTVSKVPFCFRVERIKETTRIYFLTYTKDERKLEHQLSILEQTLKANLPDFRFETVPQFTIPSIGEPQRIACSFLTGEPLSVENELQKRNALASVLETIQYLDNVVLQFFFEPRETKSSEIRKLESEYSRSIANAETTITSPHKGLFTGNEQESRRKVDPHLMRKAERLQKQLERIRNRYVCEVRVTSIAWGTNKSITKSYANKPLDILRGALVPADVEEDFTVKTKGSRRNFEKLLAGRPAGKKTTLAIPEALNYLLLPDTDLGIQVTEKAEFHSNPQRLKPQTRELRQESHDDCILGQILDDRDNPVEVLGIPLEYVPMSMGVFGDTGSGKTNTVLASLQELTEKKVHFLALCASKDEDYRPMIHINPDMLVFTPGDETTAPMRFNPHMFSEGVLVNTIINSLVASYIAAFPSMGMVKTYLEGTIKETYKKLGWDADTNTRGEPILFSDFMDIIPLIQERKLDYGDIMNSDFRGALKGRFDSLQEGPLNRVFNTLTGMTTEELVSKSSLILMEGLSDEEKAFLSALLILNIAHYFESLKKKSGYKRGPKFVIVIEEAHNLLGGAAKMSETDEGYGAVQHAIKTITRTMREGRSSGLGFQIINQFVRELPDVAVGIPRTIILHNMSSIQDRDKVCDQINCTEAQKRKVGALPVGQVVVKLPDRAQPVRANITPLFARYPEIEGAFVTNEELKAHMLKVYKKHPHYLDGVTPAEIQTGLDPRSCARFIRFAVNQRFKKIISVVINMSKKGNHLTFALNIVLFAKHIAPEPAKVPLYCQYLMRLFASYGLIPEGGFAGLEDEVVAQVKRLYDLDWAPLVASDEVVASLTSRAKAYLRSLPARDEVAVKNEVESIFRRVIEERKRYREEQSSVEMVEESLVALDPTIEEFVKNVVDTDLFAKQYFERLRKAANGDLTPIVNFVVKFAQRTEHEDDSFLHVLAQRYLEVSRETLGAPEDEELWASIVSRVSAVLGSG